MTPLAIRMTLPTCANLPQPRRTSYHAWEDAVHRTVTKNADPQAPLKKTIGQLEEKLRRKNEVVAELLEAHLSLKKELGEP